jgi:hypothetical protein
VPVAGVVLLRLLTASAALRTRRARLLLFALPARAAQPSASSRCLSSTCEAFAPRSLCWLEWMCAGVYHCASGACSTSTISIVEPTSSAGSDTKRCDKPAPHRCVSKQTPSPRTHHASPAPCACHVCAISAASVGCDVRP